LHIDTNMPCHLMSGKSQSGSAAAPFSLTAVEYNDLAARRESFYITLHEQLTLLTVRRGRQSHHAKHARAHPLGDGLDRPAFAGGVASFKRDNDPCSGGLDPLLQVAKLDLQLAQFLLVSLALHLLFGIAACRPFCRHDFPPPLQPALRTISGAPLLRCRFEPTRANR